MSDAEGESPISLPRVEQANPTLIYCQPTVIATIQTFVLAGAETSSTALTWASWVLASRPDVQEALRAELSAVAVEQPSM